MQEQTAERVSDFKPWRDWVAEHGEPVFPTHSSFEWFVRRNRERLIASGQYIVRAGANGSLVGPEIDRVVLDIMRGKGGTPA